MTYQPPAIEQDIVTVPKLPAWVTAGSGETSENVTFLSGASFAMLDLILSQKGEAVPKALLGNRLALKAAAATSKLEGRLARESDIRDAFHLTQPDADGKCHWGPDGDVLAFWRTAVRLHIANGDLHGGMVDLVGPAFEDAAPAWVDEGLEAAQRIGLLAAAIDVMKRVLEADDRAERVACLTADIVLAKFFRWDRPVPLSAMHLTKTMLRDLNSQDRDVHRTAKLAIEAALTRGTQTAYRLASDLIERAAALKALSPKLRAKGSDEAVKLFLTEDAVSPSGMLSPHIMGTRTSMTGRAARRLCDRLVELGVIKELTGRPTFRLYGVAP